MKNKIKRFYEIAFICYWAPWIILMIDITVQSTYLPWFLVITFPAGVAGLICSIIGFKKSDKYKSYLQKETGRDNIHMGIFTTILGLFGWIVMYVMIAR